MTYRIKGTLKLPDGAPAANCEIEFVSRKNFSPLVQGAKTNILTSATGAYDVTLELGEYAVIVYTGGTYPAQAGTITLSADTTPGLDLPSLLNRSDWVPATPEYMQQIEAWLVSAGEYAASAEASAQSAAESAASTAGAISTHKIESDAHSIEKITGLRGELDSLDEAAESSYVVGREALRRSYAEAGLNLVYGSFEKGGTLQSQTDVLLYEKDGKAYSWTGTYPGGGHVVVAGTDPASSAAYIPHDIDYLLNSITSNKGAGLVGFSHEIQYAAMTAGYRLKNTVYPTDAPFNAVPDWTGGSSGTDNFAALQAWMDYLHSSGKPGAIVGKFRTSQTIVKPASFKCPNIIGAGKDFAAICGPSGNSAIRLQGGSGGLANAEISGIQFESVDGTGYGLEVADLGGIDIVRCAFDKLAVGIMPHNRTSGGFTEYVIADSCTFHIGCKQALVYRRTGGNDSFHGTGLRNCTINESTTETLPKIEIGGALSTDQNIILYNAPLSFQCWKQTSTPVIKNNSTRPVCNAHGDITFETFGGGAFEVVSSAGQRFYQIGGIVDYNNVASLGKMIQMENLALLSNGTIRGIRKSYHVKPITMAAGATANTLVSLPFVSGETFLVTLEFKSSASPWTQVYVLLCHSTFGVSFVNQLAKPVGYYDGDLGSPTFSIPGGNLVATGAANWPANTVSCALTVQQIGGSRDALI